MAELSRDDGRAELSEASSLSLLWLWLRLRLRLPAWERCSPPSSQRSIACRPSVSVESLLLLCCWPPLTRPAAVCCLLRLLSPCIRCLRPFTPSALELREAGYQPVSTSAAAASHPGAFASSSVPTAATAASASASSAAAEDEWEEFEDFSGDEKDRAGDAADGRAALQQQPQQQQQQRAEEAVLVPVAAAASSLPSLRSSGPPARSPPTVSRSAASASAASSSSPDIDFFSTAGIAISGYQEPIRVQAKPQPGRQQAASASPPSLQLSAQQLSAKYGLDDDIAPDAVQGWEDDLDIDVAAASSGATAGRAAAAGRAGSRSRDRDRDRERKKKGLGAVAVVLED